MFTPLEKSRIYGPFGADVVAFLVNIYKWEPGVASRNFVLSVDAEGREYLEY